MKWITQHWIKVAAIVMLGGALLAMPYAYYQFMNWVVVIAALISAYELFKKDQQLMWVFVFVAILFNPLAPIYLTVNQWRIADIGGAVIFVAYLVWVIAKK